MTYWMAVTEGFNGKSMVGWDMYKGREGNAGEPRPFVVLASLRQIN